MTPQDFQGHAFSLEASRSGGGWAPPVGNNPVEFTDDAENLAGVHHEFGDTKFRAVTYQGTATSEYVEYFREAKVLDDLGPNPLADLNNGPYSPGVAFEGSTVQLTLAWTETVTPPLPADPYQVTRTRRLVPAPAGTPVNAPAPTPGDYVVVEDPALNDTPAAATNGTIQVLDNAVVLANWPPNLTDTDAKIDFSYVGPRIHTFSHPAADKSVHLHVLNSARPKAPKVRYVIPIYKRSVRGTTATRTGGGLRVYLERPWWSSGDQEKLGVLCWHPRAGDNGALPKDTVAPYVTQWGYDPVFKSAHVPAQPTPACFPRATSSRTDGRLTLDETTATVDVAGHDVGYDPDRRLWYCDIQVTDASGKELASYTPFIRLALARFQPFSVADAHLSKVVLADYAQLAPNRHATVSGSSDISRTVTVVGRAAIGTALEPEPGVADGRDHRGAGHPDHRRRDRVVAGVRTQRLQEPDRVDRHPLGELRRGQLAGVRAASGGQHQAAADQLRGVRADQHDRRGPAGLHREHSAQPRRHRLTVPSCQARAPGSAGTSTAYC